MKDTFRKAFLICVFAIMLVPFAGMSFAQTTTTTENRDLAAWPSFDDGMGGLNVNWLPEAGSYFEDHFALRNQMVTADAKLRSGVFGVSSSSQVVVGTDGWLYYSGTMGDYLRRQSYSDRELDNIAFNLRLTQNYVLGYGSNFCFTIAPDKASLYPANMPFYYRPADNQTLCEQLESYLESYGINYTNLFTDLGKSGQALYYQRDTHWTNAGAALAAESIVSDTDPEKATHYVVSSSDSVEHWGDIDKMLYPLGPTVEMDDTYQLSDWSMVVGDNVESSQIETVNKAADGTLLMFRDSFGNALLPFMAASYNHAYFDKLTPYNITEMVGSKADTVVIEKAERNIGEFATKPPIMPAPKTTLSAVVYKSQTETTLDTTVDGDYLVIRGVLDSSYCGTNYNTIQIVVSDGKGNATAYTPYHVSVNDGETNSDYGYLAYVRSATLPSGDYRVAVTMSDGSSGEIVAEKEMDMNE